MMQPKDQNDKVTGHVSIGYGTYIGLINGTVPYDINVGSIIPCLVIEACIVLRPIVSNPFKVIEKVRSGASKLSPLSTNSAKTTFA